MMYQQLLPHTASRPNATFYDNTSYISLSKTYHQLTHNISFPLQKDDTQLGLLALSAMLASHSVDEAKRYSANACYELRDDTAAPLKLVSVLTIAACLVLKLH
jgi:hypothetical protein